MPSKLEMMTMASVGMAGGSEKRNRRNGNPEQLFKLERVNRRIDPRRSVLKHRLKAATPSGGQCLVFRQAQNSATARICERCSSF